MSRVPSFEEVVNQASSYWEAWQRFLALAPGVRQIIGQHTPSAVSWKVEGPIAPLQVASELFELGDSVHMGPVDKERSILTIRRPAPFALDTLQHIKILQRRPSRPEDSLGMDSLDFYVPHGLPSSDDILEAAGDVKFTCQAESNAVHSWLSLTVDGREFKLARYHVWRICVQEAAAVIEAQLQTDHSS